MDLNQIQALIKFVAKSGVSEVDLETKDFKINIKTTVAKSASGVEATYVPMQMPAMPQAMQVPAPAPAPAQPVAPTSGGTEDAGKKDDESKYITIKSPMIGTFYRASSPETPPFANVGDDINPGKVICIIEAMKLFNEIESEVSGKIVKVLVDDSTPVEYDQPLFLVDPS